MIASAGDALPPIIVLPPEIDTRDAALRYLISHLVKLGEVAADRVEEIIKHLLKRESLGPTAIGRGLALPHCRGPVDRVQTIFGRSAKGIDWPDAVDAAPVHVVCLFVAPIDYGRSEQLRVLEKLAQHLRQAFGKEWPPDLSPG